MKRDWSIRLAREDDVATLEVLIPFSARILQAAYYPQQAIEAALGPVFGVDRQLIRDGTYFVAEHAETVIACGGWSRRKALFGGDSARVADESELDPLSDRARIRAFFVHPNWARQGIGRAILATCEEAIRAASFREAELVATLAGEPLYAAAGYRVEHRHEIPLSGGMSLHAVTMSKRLA